MITSAFSIQFTDAVLDPRITFTRTGATATRVNASGYIESMAADTPRFDYNAITGVCKGLLIEKTTTNELTWSQDFENWTYVVGTLTTNAGTAPDNTSTADKFVGPSGQSGWVFYRLGGFSFTGSTTYTLSIYLKPDAQTSVYLNYLDNSTGGYTGGTSVFSLVGNGSVVSNAGGAVGAIELTKNGWYRASITFTTVASPNFNYVEFGSTAVGNDVDGFYLWGVQLEKNAAPSSYIPTNAATSTRNADVAVITGSNFSDWWQAGYGGAIVQAQPNLVDGVYPWVQFDDDTANEIIAIRGNGTNPELYIVDNGVTQAQIDAGTIAAGISYSFTGWWATNDCKAKLGTGSVVTDTTATIPTVTQARLGSDGTNYLNGHLASVSYYNSFFDRIYTRRKNKAVFSLL